MQKLTYSTSINASDIKVYKAMLGLDSIKTYEEWTAPFNPTSTYEGKWDKGSKIYFLGFGEDGKKGGMVSEIAENIPAKHVSIRHYGILNGDQEITEGPEVEKWAGGHENYTFEEKNGITTVTVHVDVIDEYLDFFNNTYPKALEKLKEICEK
ncbi:MAG: SRPBCC domain-containing protein [Bacteroidia bacterium]|jgi:hypothetical protein|nr:SRPBCC domain-containing protein [Bacteroidia bacterium]